ncbi:MAG: hypothetical protein GY842_24460, partial [bacterium]|nr:hypothetical protein [bacterium]
CGLLAGLCAMGYGKIIYVDDDVVWADDGISWVSAFTYLQDALAVAEPGDEVRVAQGLYRPDQGAGMAPGDRDATFLLVSGATLAGGYAGSAGADPNARDVKWCETILSGDLNGDDGPEFSNYSDNSRYGVVSSLGNDAATALKGFTITGGYSGEGAGIRCFDSDTLISECRIARNRAENRGAGMVSYYGSPVLRQCVFEDNEAAGHGGGLWSEGGSLQLTKCDFVN